MVSPEFVDIDIVFNKERTLSKADEAFLSMLLEGTTWLGHGSTEIVPRPEGS